MHRFSLESGRTLDSFNVPENFVLVLGSSELFRMNGFML